MVAGVKWAHVGCTPNGQGGSLLSVPHLQGASVGLTVWAEDAIHGLSVVASVMRTVEGLFWASITPYCGQDEDCSRRC